MDATTRCDLFGHLVADVCLGKKANHIIGGLFLRNALLRKVGASRPDALSILLRHSHVAHVGLQSNTGTLKHNFRTSWVCFFILRLCFGTSGLSSGLWDAVWGLTPSALPGSGGPPPQFGSKGWLRADYRGGPRDLGSLPKDLGQRGRRVPKRVPKRAPK